MRDIHESSCIEERSNPVSVSWKDYWAVESIRAIFGLAIVVRMNGWVITKPWMTMNECGGNHMNDNELVYIPCIVPWKLIMQRE